MALFPVHEAEIKNGLRIRMLPDDTVPLVSFYTFFRVGSRNERPGTTGISHLFEHMMFNGAKKYGPKAFDNVLEAHGGSSNAYTTCDMTVYHEEFPVDALEKVIDLESDRMRSLKISASTLEKEREVVMEERRMRVDNEIAGLMDEELSSLVWKAHPYRWPVIGWMGDIQNITQADCTDFFSRYYAPNNATLWVTGAIDAAQTLKWVRRYYSDIPSGKAPVPVLDAEPEQKGERRAKIEHPAHAPSVMIAFRGPSGHHDDAWTLDVLQFALAVGESSILTQRLVHQREVAVHVSLDWGGRIDPGMIGIFMELSPGTDPARAESALYEELSEIAAKGLSERTLQKAKNNLKAHLLYELSTNRGRANALGTYELLLGSWRKGLGLKEKYQTITQEQVKAAAQKYFSPLRRSVVTLVPDGTH